MGMERGWQRARISIPKKVLQLGAKYRFWNLVNAVCFANLKKGWKSIHATSFSQSFKHKRTHHWPIENIYLSRKTICKTNPMFVLSTLSCTAASHGQERKLNILHMRYLRDHLHHVSSMSTLPKQTRMRWLGHIVRINDSPIPVLSFIRRNRSGKTTHSLLHRWGDAALESSV